MSLLEDFYVNTGEIRLPDNEIITRPIAADRPSFAVLGSSGEFPLGIRPPAPDLIDPAATLRISVPVTYGSPIPLAVPRRPWFYRGTHRWTRSLALLTAATWPGGAR
jgi:hypothetical protein